MKERLLRTYFIEGRNIADLETLVELASEVGLAGGRGAVDAVVE